MTITTRSKRITAFGTDSPTPATVAPGSYAPEQVATSFGTRAQRPLFSTFATSERRSLKTTSASTPGPGAYIADSRHQQISSLSNVFASKISRFAPSAPGSTVFLASSIQDNPGPGSYSRPASWPSSNNQRDYQGSHKVAIVVKPSVPAIPQRQQSYGYVQVGVELQRQSPPKDSYSGVGHDTVGPAVYNSHNSLWDDKRNGASSLKSTAKRDVWAENNRLMKLPGPGQYDVKTEIMMATPTMLILKDQRLRLNAQRSQHHGARQRAPVTFKVPILASYKSVEGHDLKRKHEKCAKEERAERHRQEQSRPRGLRLKTEAFGSTTGRTDLVSHITTPFSHPTYMTTPGPGRYGVARTNNSSQQLGTNLSGASIPHHRPDGMGFSCVTERPCLVNAKTPAAPGPGTYKSETPRSLNQAVIVKLGIGRNGVFGTTAERKFWGEEAFTPGPGAYSECGSFDTKHYLNSAAFKSASLRFAKNALPHAPPHVHCVGDLVAPAVGQYNVSKDFLNCASGMPGPLEGANASDIMSFQSRVPFLSTQERSVFEIRDASDLPGPGAYMDSGDNSGTLLTRSRDVRLTVGNEARFRTTPSLPDNVGPGSYIIPGTVGTKSFNVTMTRKDHCDANFTKGRPTSLQHNKARS